MKYIITLLSFILCLNLSAQITPNNSIDEAVEYMVTHKDYKGRFIQVMKKYKVKKKNWRLTAKLALIWAMENRSSGPKTRAKAGISGKLFTISVRVLNQRTKAEIAASDIAISDRFKMAEEASKIDVAASGGCHYSKKNHRGSSTTGNKSSKGAFSGNKN